MRECVGCSCAAVCLPLGQNEFLDRMYVCTTCNYPVYAPANAIPLFRESPFGEGIRHCAPVCWAHHSSMLEHGFVGGRGYTTCKQCRRRLADEQKQVVTVESDPGNDQLPNGVAYQWIVRR